MYYTTVTRWHNNRRIPIKQINYLSWRTRESVGQTRADLFEMPLTRPVWITMCTPIVKVNSLWTTNTKHIAIKITPVVRKISKTTYYIFVKNKYLSYFIFWIRIRLGRRLQVCFRHLIRHVKGLSINLIPSNEKKKL